MKGILSRRALLALAAVGAVVGGALVMGPGESKAAAFGGGSAVVWTVNSDRLEGGGGDVHCTGTCRVFTAELDDFRMCPLRLGVRASHAACVTALNAACATTCKSNP